MHSRHHFRQRPARLFAHLSPCGRAIVAGAGWPAGVSWLLDRERVPL